MLGLKWSVRPGLAKSAPFGGGGAESASIRVLAAGSFPQPGRIRQSVVCWFPMTPKECLRWPAMVSRPTRWCGAGRFMPSSEGPTGPDTRPFGLRFGVRPVELGKHSKQPTNKTRTDQTEITDDG